jgi:hypothetical protein
MSASWRHFQPMKEYVPRGVRSPLTAIMLLKKIRSQPRYFHGVLQKSQVLQQDENGWKSGAVNAHGK